MPVYFMDSSAMVKRYVNEIGSAWVASLLSAGAGNLIHLSRLAEVEVISALARRERAGTLSAGAAAVAMGQFLSDLVGRLQVVEIAPPTITHAVVLARTHALRGADAIQLAAALEAINRHVTSGSAVTLVSADAALNSAAAAEGLAADDPNLHP